MARGASDFYLGQASGLMVRTPFNGQEYRRLLIDELFQDDAFSAIIETGTGYGASTEYFVSNFGKPIYSCEIDPRRYAYCVCRLRTYQGVRLYNQESRQFLESLRRLDEVPRRHIFFYLDAHWGDHLPLAAEVDFICRNWEDSVVVIDDFKVPMDDGYGFDRYGQHTLDLEYLEPLGRFSQIAFPACKSQDETGAKRGAVVLSTAGRKAIKLDRNRRLRLFKQ